MIIPLENNELNQEEKMITKDQLGGGGGSIAGISTTGTSTFNHISVGGTAEFFNSANRIYGGNTILNINQTSPNGLVAIGGSFVGFYNSELNEYKLSTSEIPIQVCLQRTY